MNEEKRHFDEDVVIRSNDGKGEEFGGVVEARLSRRDVMLGAAGAGLMLSAAKLTANAPKMSPTGLDFTPISSSTGENVVVAKGYKVQTLISWGDPTVGAQDRMAEGTMDAAQQARAFGYNNDFVGYLPLPFGSKKSDHGLLAVNHEYVNPEMMFPIANEKDVNAEQVDICMEAVGFSVTEIKRGKSGWSVVMSGGLNKRYTATTPMLIGGPARGSRRMTTAKHADGTTCTGTMSNCSAGTTPWGTVLTGEENFQSMFGNAKTLTSEIDKRSAKRYGLGMDESEYGWEKFLDRFDCAKTPNEANHFGWVVEIDPYDPTWTPVKRTALGRCRHEAATTFISKSGRVVMYTGDDARFEYVYKFVSSKSYDKKNRTANRDLLDDGVLYVAKFNADGSGEWLPLVHGYGRLTAANGFSDQGDVVIDVRIAADLLGATKMDRPEDIEVNPTNKKVYIVCTNNVDRGLNGKEGETNSNPRNENKHGHIVELTELRDDHAATSFKWELFMVCGDPSDPATYYAGYDKSKVCAVSCPDNILFDKRGNLWIATDGQEKTLKVRDGLFAVPTDGPERGKLIQFMASVPGAEVCGPEFTPDGKTLFLAIQHPGEGSSFAKPSTSWPDGIGIPRPSVVVITSESGGVIGG